MPPQPWKSATAGAGELAAANQNAVRTMGALASPSRLGNETCSWASAETSIATAAIPMATRNQPRMSRIGVPARLDRGRVGMDARHRESVDVAPVAHRIAAKPAFRLEAELAIERDGRDVVDVDRELDAQHAHPAVGVVAHRLHQRRADALALRFARDRNADHRGVAAAQRRADRMQAGGADDLAAPLGDEREIDLARRRAFDEAGCLL